MTKLRGPWHLINQHQKTLLCHCLATAIHSSVFCGVRMAFAQVMFCDGCASCVCVFCVHCCVIVLRLSFCSIDAIIVRVMLRHCLRCHVLRCAIVICPSHVLRLSRVVRVRFLCGCVRVIAIFAHRFVQGFFKGLRVPCCNGREALGGCKSKL